MRNHAPSMLAALALPLLVLAGCAANEPSPVEVPPPTTASTVAATAQPTGVPSTPPAASATASALPTAAASASAPKTSASADPASPAPALPARDKGWGPSPPLGVTYTHTLPRFGPHPTTGEKYQVNPDGTAWFAAGGCPHSEVCVGHVSPKQHERLYQLGVAYWRAASLVGKRPGRKRGEPDTVIQLEKNGTFDGGEVKRSGNAYDVLMAAIADTKKTLVCTKLAGKCSH